MSSIRHLAAVTLLLAPITPAIAAPLTFTLEASVSAISPDNPAPPAIQTFLSGRYPVGSGLTLTLTLETATPAGPGVNEYRGSVTGRSGSLGGDALADSSAPATCLAADIECRASVASFASSTFLSISSGFLDVAGLQAAGDAAGLGADLFAEAFLTFSFAEADFDTTDGLDFDPADIIGGSGVFTLFSFAGGTLNRTVLELDVQRIYPGEPAISAVPQPATLLLLATALLGFGLRPRGSLTG